jgi:hypothetical protein
MTNPRGIKIATATPSCRHQLPRIAPPRFNFRDLQIINKFPIHAVLEESVLNEAMPEWNKCILSWAKLSILPVSWCDKLRGWRGIYYIYDRTDRMGYVGAAYGEDNILGRWEHYAESGHGGNALLRNRSPENFNFSILELVSPNMEPDAGIKLETTWKDRLHTRPPFGLNDN